MDKCRICGARLDEDEVGELFCDRCLAIEQGKQPAAVCPCGDPLLSIAEEAEGICTLCALAGEIRL